MELTFVEPPETKILNATINIRSSKNKMLIFLLLLLTLQLEFKIEPYYDQGQSQLLL